MTKRMYAGMRVGQRRGSVEGASVPDNQSGIEFLGTHLTWGEEIDASGPGDGDHVVSFRHRTRA